MGLKAKCDGKGCSVAIGDLEIIAYAGTTMAPGGNAQIAHFDAIVPAGWHMETLPNGRRKLYCDACLAAYHARFADIA